MSVQTTLTEEVTVSVERDDRLLPLIGDNANLNLALLNEEDGIRPVPCEKTF